MGNSRKSGCHVVWMFMMRVYVPLKVKNSMVIPQSRRVGYFTPRRDGQTCQSAQYECQDAVCWGYFFNSEHVVYGDISCRCCHVLATHTRMAWVDS